MLFRSAEGDTEGEMLADGLRLALGPIEGLTEAEGESDADGERDAEADADGLKDADGDSDALGDKEAEPPTKLKLLENSTQPGSVVTFVLPSVRSVDPVLP